MTLDDLRTGDIVEFEFETELMKFAAAGKHSVVIPSNDEEDSFGLCFYPFGGDFKSFNINMESESCSVVKVFKSSEPFTDLAFAAIREIIQHGKLNGIEDRIKWTWEKSKEDELRVEKMKAFVELAEIRTKLNLINEKLNKMQQFETAINMIVKIAKEIDWNSWELESEDR